MKKIDSIVIFYFTGTGNSGKVAEWINQVAAEKGIPCKVINIAKINRDKSSLKLLLNPSPFDQSSSDIQLPYYFFIGPTHGFNYPPVLLNFILKFPKGANQVALLNTRAGMRIGKWITPGLSGIALFFSSFLLKIKGYKIHSLCPVDLPSNWISIHPGLNTRTVTFLHLQNRKRVRQIATKILNGNKVNRAYWDIVQDLIISPVSLAYYFVGRFVFAKTFFASSDCTKCGLCIRQCPVKAIKTIHDRPFWSYRCESCMKCMNNCPDKAIQTGHGYIIGLSVLYTSVLIGLFYKGLDGMMIEIKSHWIEFLINNGLFIIFLFIGYRIIHYLLRFKLFSKLAEFTSLTRYRFWGKRYRALKENQY